MTPERFKTLASVMIAVVTVVGAGVACRASVASNAADNADFAGLVAAIRAEETRLINYITVYEHYQAYTIYQRYNELGNLLFDEAQQSGPGGGESLDRLRREAWGVALGLQYSFFPPRYLNPDGTYNLQRELDEEWAEQSQRSDVSPEAHFKRADTARLKTGLLAGTLIIFSVAFWCFTVAQAINNRLRFVFGLAGFAVTLAGLAAFLLVEVAL
jgi:hypothetical protein